MGVSGEFSFVTGRVAMRRGLNDVAFRYDEAIEGKFPWGVYPMPTGPGGRFAFGGNSRNVLASGGSKPLISCTGNRDRDLRKTRSLSNPANRKEKVFTLPAPHHDQDHRGRTKANDR